MNNTKRTREMPARYIVVNEATNRIVGSTVGTHDILNRMVDNLGAEFYFYDDASAAHRYLPQIGHPVTLSAQRRAS